MKDDKQPNIHANQPQAGHLVTVLRFRIWRPPWVVVELNIFVRGGDLKLGAGGMIVGVVCTRYIYIIRTR